jgi:hypothetical protein
VLPLPKLKRLRSLFCEGVLCVSVKDNTKEITPSLECSALCVSWVDELLWAYRFELSIVVCMCIAALNGRDDNEWNVLIDYLIYMEHLFWVTSIQRYGLLDVSSTFTCVLSL